MTTTFPSSSDGSEDTREGRPSQSTLCCKYPVNKSSLVLTRAVGGGSYLHSVTAGDLTVRVDTGRSSQSSCSTLHTEHLGLLTALSLRSQTDSGNLSFPLFVPAFARLHLRLVLLLPLKPPVLEPDHDLAFRQRERVSDLYSLTVGEISVELELLLEHQGLVSGVGLLTASLRSKTDSGNLSLPLSPSEGSSVVSSKVVLIALSEKTILLVV